ncbi:hypothetical protein CK203_024015 [Vitis vinifera]|uniref:Uncharacterized protein n=1 Tax=Vitis vinifera TaxID=29760 RepID=A0A438IQG5_VITVI|nr:hypothetical protein CK203_024015 [Vitis vinifera]
MIYFLCLPSTSNRYQKEEALNFRVAKDTEINQLEKMLKYHDLLQELTVEIGALERQRDEFEAELKKVNASLAAARARLHNAREESEQFAEASNQIVIHLKAREDELSRSLASCRVEAHVVTTWINFLEDTWTLQRAYTAQNENQVRDELEKIWRLLREFSYSSSLCLQGIDSLNAPEELEPSVSRVKKLVQNLSGGSAIIPSMGDENSKAMNLRKNLEEEYLDYEAKFITTFSVVVSMKKQFYAQNEDLSRDKALDREAELLELESEFGKSSRDHSSDEISDWVCDELERPPSLRSTPRFLVAFNIKRYGGFHHSHHLSKSDANQHSSSQGLVTWTRRHYGPIAPLDPYACSYRTHGKLEIPTALSERAKNLPRLGQGKWGDP